MILCSALEDASLGLYARVDHVACCLNRCAVAVACGSKADYGSSAGNLEENWPLRSNNSAGHDGADLKLTSAPNQDRCVRVQ